MTVRTVNNLPAATHGETVRCLFAIELSKKSWVIGFNTPLSEKISRRTLSGCDWKGLLELIEEVRARVSREMGRAVEVMSCYEAGYDGFWLHRQLEAHGVRNYVIDPASLQVDRRARRVKTDRIDAERLLRSLMAYLRGEPKVWSVVRVPSVAEEDARRLHRERDRLVSERVQHVNRIKGLCALHGIYDYHPLRPQAMARLEQLRTAQGGALPPRLKSEIKRELHRLELVVEMIATLEAERDAIVEDEASTHLNAEKIQNLHKLKAIGPEFAAVLVGEIFHRELQQSPPTGELCRRHAEPVPEREHGARARDQQGRQPQGANHRDRTRLAVAALSARQRFEHLVPGACRYHERPHPSHRHRGVGTQAAGGVMALS